MGINFGATNPVTVANGIQQVATSTGGVTLDLSKGATLDLTKRDPGLKNVIAAVGWDANTTVPAFDLDLSVLLLNGNGKVSSVTDIIYFRQRNAQGVALSEDDRTGSGDGDDETVVVNLNEISPSVQSIVFIVNIYEAQERRQTFGMVSNSYIRLLNMDKNNEEICRYRLKEDFGSSTAAIFAKLKRDGADWQFETIGDGKIVKDLNDIVAMYM